MCSFVSTGAAAWVLFAGAGVADAATRYRSGIVRANLVDATARVAPNGSASSGLHLTGPDVMASFVALMAVLAFLFLVVTLIRRRVHSPLVTHTRAA
jgi:hypothetical protein